MIKGISLENKRKYRNYINSDLAYDLLTQLNEHHNETYVHSIRVGLISLEIGSRLGLSEEELETVVFGGMLHDIGKLKIPIEILDKSTSLDDEEMQVMKNHSRYGFELLKNFPLEGIREIIVGHHEHKTLNPYPRRKSNSQIEVCRRKNDEKISFLTEIVAIADIYDALYNKRGYKEEFDMDEIRKAFERDYSGDKKIVEFAIDIDKKIET